MTICPKCKKWELSKDGVCDLCNLVDGIFRECGPQAVADTRAACEKVNCQLVRR